MARGHRLVSGGTDTHLMLVDLTARGITGKDAQEALDRAWITVNKNGIPFDTKGPMVTSGIRIGTPAVTTRGMREPEMVAIAACIDRVLAGLGNKAVEAAVRAEVAELTGRFPLYAERLAREVPVLRPQRGPGGRLARRPRRRVHPPPARVPQVPPPLHDVRVHRGRAAARGQARRAARALRSPEAARLHPQGMREALGRRPGGRRRRRRHRVAPARARGERDLALELGELVMEHLQKLDQVAYVRFASVYRQFKDIAQFMDEVKGLIKEGRSRNPAPVAQSSRGPAAAQSPVGFYFSPPSSSPPPPPSPPPPCAARGQWAPRAGEARRCSRRFTNS